MRLLARTLASLAALTLASCATPALAFAETTPAPTVAVETAPAIAGVSAARTPKPSAPIPSAPTAPSEIPAPEPVVAIEEETPGDPRLAVIDRWFAKHFHGLGPHLTEYLHGRLLAAVDDLKALLLELPIS